MFIRTKKVKERDYAYLVKNIWTKKGPRQKTIKYLGLVLPLNESNSDIISLSDIEKTIKNKSTIDVYKILIKRELIRHGFVIKDNLLTQQEIIVNLEKPFVKKRKRNVVLRMNEGFLCKETIIALFDHTSQEDHTGKRLAEDILEAGINIEKDVFVKLYEKLKH